MIHDECATNGALLRKITGREASLFVKDIQRHHAALRSRCSRSRILVIGAAGSVGSSFVKQLALFSPHALHLVDLSENNLVEVVRDLRSSVALPADFKAMPIALGSLEFERFLDSEPSYDSILNFSALKHVRSEKDPFSLMRMFCTNVLYVYRLLDRLARSGSAVKFFSVSSDKAVRPHSLMGATKIFMERVHLLFSDRIPFSSARFANVAFSDGSLLHGFRVRFEKGQPLAAPSDVRRYFISHEEAGQLCLGASFLGDNREIFFPKLDPHSNLVTFSAIAEEFLRLRGYEPKLCGSEDEAKAASSERKDNDRSWPCHFFTSDTTGEKPFEEFYTETDQVSFERFENIGVISQEGIGNGENIRMALDMMEKIRNSPRWSKEEMVEAIRCAVPELEHTERNRNLDQKM